MRLAAAGAILALPLLATVVLAAANTVPTTSLYHGTHAVTPLVDFRPPECTGTYTAFYSGGSSIGGAGPDLMLGTDLIDTLLANGGNDCLVSGAGIDIVNAGTGTDVCIVGNETPLLNISGCETIIRRP